MECQGRNGPQAPHLQLLSKARSAFSCTWLIERLYLPLSHCWRASFMHQSTVRMLFLHSDGSSLLGSELSISWKRFQGYIQTKPKMSASDWMHSFESASVFCSQARWRVLRGCSAAPGLTPVFQNAGCVTGRETVLMGVTNFLLLAVVNSSELIISKNEASSRRVFARCHFVATYFVPQQIKEPTNQTPTANLCVTFMFRANMWSSG